MYYSQDFYEVMISARQEQCRRASFRRQGPRAPRLGRVAAWLRRRHTVETQPATITALPIGPTTEPTAEAA
jgi:hypothetical protein